MSSKIPLYRRLPKRRKKRSNSLRRSVSKQKKQLDWLKKVPAAVTYVLRLLADSFYVDLLSVLASIHQKLCAPYLHATHLMTAEALRLEAQEQARKAAQEEKRQQLIQVQTEQENARLASERSQVICLLSSSINYTAGEAACPCTKH